MRDSELRGAILEALYNQRRKDLVNLDQELQLVKKGLAERPIHDRLDF